MAKRFISDPFRLTSGCSKFLVRGIASFETGNDVIKRFVHTFPDLFRADFQILPGIFRLPWSSVFRVLAQVQYIRLGCGSFAGKGLDLLFDVSPNLCPCFLCFGFLLIARAGPRRYAHQTEARRAYYTNRIMILPSHQRRLLR